MQTELISGRFDPPHLGHLITIGRELARFDKVIVVVLDDGKQMYPISYRMDVLTEAVSMLGGVPSSVKIERYKTHFGNIVRDEIDRWRFDVYGSGNMDVLRHVSSLGIQCRYIPRAYDYEASNERLGRKIRNILSLEE